MSSSVKKIENPVNTINHQLYTHPNAVQGKGVDITPSLIDVEKVIFDKLTPHLKNKKILNIGVGRGRETTFLLDISQDYVGVDYSEPAVDFCKSQYPSVNFMYQDARIMTAFEDNTFDAVIFINNGIDYVIHEDRLKILSEIYRVLKPEGYFAFSTHNRDFEHFGKLFSLQFSLNPIKQLAYLKRYLVCQYRYLNTQKYSVENTTYAIINDGTCNGKLLSYYISVPNQQKQLNEIGFTNNIDAYDLSGDLISPSQIATDYYIHYVTQKPA